MLSKIKDIRDFQSFGSDKIDLIKHTDFMSIEHNKMEAQ